MCKSAVATRMPRKDKQHLLSHRAVWCFWVGLGLAPRFCLGTGLHIPSSYRQWLRWDRWLSPWWGKGQSVRRKLSQGTAVKALAYLCLQIVQAILASLGTGDDVPATVGEKDELIQMTPVQKGGKLATHQPKDFMMNEWVWKMANFFSNIGNGNKKCIEMTLNNFLK